MWKILFSLDLPWALQILYQATTSAICHKGFIFRCYSFCKLLLQSVLTWFVVAVQSSCWTSTDALYLRHSSTSWSLSVVSLHNLSAICKDPLCTSQGFFWAYFELVLIAARVSPFSVDPGWTLNTKRSAEELRPQCWPGLCQELLFPWFPN